MAGYEDLLKFAPKVSQDSTQSEVVPSQAQAAPAAIPSGSLKSYEGLAQFAPPAEQLQRMGAPAAPENGAYPETSVPDSPLSLGERAMLGWVRTPVEQERYLKTKYQDVKQLSNSDGAYFVVKDKDGLWKQVDPAFQWHFDATAAAGAGAAGLLGGGLIGAGLMGAIGGFAGSMNKTNLKDLPGDIAQFAGEYGLRSLAAAGGAAAVAATAPVSIPTILAGVGAAGLASAGAEALDLGSRAALSDPNAIGAKPYKNAGEIANQMYLSALFGMEQEMGGKITEKAIGKVAETMGNVVKKLSNTPEGQQMVRGIFSKLGADDKLVAARLENPMRNAKFDEMAVNDTKMPLDLNKQQLPKAEDGVFNQIYDQMLGIKNREGTEFAKLKALPEVRNATINASSSVADAVKGLVENGYVKVTPARAAESGLGDVESFAALKDVPNALKTAKMSIADRTFGEGDKEAINKILSYVRKGSNLSYDDARALTQDMGTLLEKGVSADPIKRSVVRLKEGVHNNIIESIGDKAGGKYGEILGKYADAKGLLQDIEKATDGPKKFTLVKKLMSDENNGGKETMGALLQAGVDKDLLVQLYQIQGAKQAVSWFAPGTGLKRFIPNGGKLPAAVISPAAGAKDSVINPVTEKTLPYMDKALRMLRTADPKTRAAALKDPSFMSEVEKVISGAAIGEQQTKQQLLQQAGIQAPSGGQQ